MKQMFILALALAGAAPADAAVRFTVKDLGTLGGTLSVANGINASGQVTGISTLSTGSVRAFVTDSAGTMVSLGTLGGDYSAAVGISDSGRVAGYGYTAANALRSFVSDSAGALVEMGSLGGGGTFAYGMSASGRVVGTSSTADKQSFAFRTNAAGEMEAAGAPETTGVAINDAGQIAGYRLDRGTFRYGAVRIEVDGSAKDLGTFGGTRSQAYGINASGQVVGFATTEQDAAVLAFRTDEAGTLISLGTIGTASSYAYGINAAGQVVGRLQGASGERAMFYDGTTMFDLNDLVEPVAGVVLNYAAAINDAGQIVGYGTFDGKNRAFRLDVIADAASPAPESATWGMMLLGFGLVGRAMRSRRRSGTFSAA